MPSRLQPAWSLIGASVRGAAHVRANLPNQDAINIWSPAHSAGLLRHRGGVRWAWERQMLPQ